MVHTDGLAASILSTVNKRLGALIGKINIIMNFAEHPHMYGMRNNMCARTLYKSEEVTSQLNKSASWIGLTYEIVDKLQDFQNKFILRFFEALNMGPEPA